MLDPISKHKKTGITFQNDQQHILYIFSEKAEIEAGPEIQKQLSHFKKPVSHYKMIVDAYFMHFVKKKKDKKGRDRKL